MGTVALLAAFLLAASANPITNSNDHSPEDAPDAHDTHTDSDHVTDSDHSSQSSSRGDTVSSSDEPRASSNEAPQNTENPVDPDNTDPYSGDSDPGHLDKENSNNGGADSSDGLSSEVSTASTASTTSPSIEDSTTTNTTIPEDADPVDCRARNPKKHIYLECQFSCEGDMMELALDNSTCLLNYTLNAAAANASTRPNGNKTGVCLKGDCVPKPAEVTEATPEPSPTDLTSTPSITEASPESSPTETTHTTGITENESTLTTPKSGASLESSSPEAPTWPDDSGVNSTISSEPPLPTRDFSPVAMA